MFRSDLTFKVTAGPDGTHLIHLLSTPGSKLTFGHGGFAGQYSLMNCACWYTYYDVSGEGDNTAEQCMLDNKDSILIKCLYEQYKLADLYMLLIQFKQFGTK